MLCLDFFHLAIYHLNPYNPVLSLAAYLWLRPDLCSLVNMNYSKGAMPIFVLLCHNHKHIISEPQERLLILRKVMAYPRYINADVDPRGGIDRCILQWCLIYFPVCSLHSTITTLLFNRLETDFTLLNIPVICFQKWWTEWDGWKGICAHIPVCTPLSFLPILPVGS